MYIEINLHWSSTSLSASSSVWFKGHGLHLYLIKQGYVGQYNLIVWHFYSNSLRLKRDDYINILMQLDNSWAKTDVPNYWKALKFSYRFLTLCDKEKERGFNINVIKRKNSTIYNMKYYNKEHYHKFSKNLFSTNHLQIIFLITEMRIIVNVHDSVFLDNHFHWGQN